MDKKWRCDFLIYFQVHIKVPCSMCGEMVSKGKFNYHMMQKHVPASEKKHKCDYCGKGFSETSRLRDHINVHTGEKPHKCRFCNTGFASIGNKAAHERSHLGLKRKSSGASPAKNPFPPLNLHQSRSRLFKTKQNPKLKIYLSVAKLKIAF